MDRFFLNRAPVTHISVILTSINIRTYSRETKEHPEGYEDILSSAYLLSYLNKYLMDFNWIACI